ncbi:unnamed protein product [Prorocentrum cordatum]|uniref:Uncharacterized protein n=1 Tax=Prorocentrum cordatum TaxID=2364126 RepID=A0ABN9SQN0_9DINO|nr:unnamed protein product [Polarella glacialis]
MEEDHGEAQAQHGRAQELQRTRVADLQQRLLEMEEKCQGHQQEGDRLKRDLEEAKNELERAGMALRQEQDRFEQTLEAKEASARSGERVLQSQLEEKDTLLEHRDSTIRNLEKDLEDAKKKAAELEEAVARSREEGESKAHLAGVRNAQLEGEVRRRQERLDEVEGRLEAQRQYLEQVQSTLGQEREDKGKILELKGSLEAQLQLESTHKQAVSESLHRAQEDSERRIKVSALEAERLELDMSEVGNSYKQRVHDFHGQGSEWLVEIRVAVRVEAEWGVGGSVGTVSVAQRVGAGSKESEVGALPVLAGTLPVLGGSGKGGRSQPSLAWSAASDSAPRPVPLEPRRRRRDGDEGQPFPLPCGVEAALQGRWHAGPLLGPLTVEGPHVRYDTALGGELLLLTGSSDGRVSLGKWKAAVEGAAPKSLRWADIGDAEEVNVIVWERLAGRGPRPLAAGAAAAGEAGTLLASLGDA